MNQPATRPVVLQWLLVITYAALIACVTSLPALLFALNTPQDWHYTGALPLPDGFKLDYQVYISSMWQGARGDFAYHLPYTHEAHIGIPLVHITYMLLGALARLVTLDFALMYHIARFALTFGMVLALWAFMCRFVQHTLVRWLALVFATLGSGWSWALLILAPALTQTVSPIEFWLIDAFNLFGALTTPHFALVIILQVGIILGLDAWLRHGKPLMLILLTVALAYNAGVQPYAAPFWAALVGGVVLVGWLRGMVTIRRAAWLAIPLGVHGLLVVYVYLTMNNDPIWASFLQQTATASPPVAFYIAAYAPYWLPLLLTLPNMPRLVRDDNAWLWVMLWVVLVVILLYAPLPSQRRYLIGFQTPLALLAALGWARLIGLSWVQPALSVQEASEKTRRQIIINTLKIGVTALYVTVVSAGTLVLIGGNVAQALSPQSNAEMYFDEAQQAAYAWLRDNAAPDALTMSVFDLNGPGNGGWLGMATGQRVYMGHWAMTAYADDKLAHLRQFFASDSDDAWRRDFLISTGTRYIWYDTITAQLGDWQPQDAAYLQRVFENAHVSIFDVRLDESDS